MTQFLRTVQLTIGELRVASPLHITFEVERSVHGRGKAKATVANLTRSQQSEIESAADAQLIIEAGYEENRGLEMLFSGRVARGHGHDQPSRGTRAEGRDVISFVEGTDAGLETRERRVSASFEPGVQLATVVRTCADALGLGEGNLEDALGSIGSPTLPAGTVLSGNASAELTGLLASFDLAWSPQFGALQVTTVGGVLPVEAVLLTPDTGLVGEPELGTRGRARVTSLLTRDIAPGRPVLLEHPRLQANQRGRYVARAVRYSGDSSGGDFYALADLQRAA